MIVLYRPDSEQARGTESFLRDLTKQHDLDPRDIRIINMDSPEGLSLASVYDIMAFPAIIVTDNEGAYVKHWAGDLPLMSELMGYLLTQ